MSPARMAKIESAMRTAMDLNKAFNAHDVQAMKALIADDCILESFGPAPDGSTYKGKEAIAHYWHTLFIRSPNVRIEIEDVFGLGNRCVMRWRSEGMDIDERGPHFRGVDIYQVRSASIFQIFSYTKG